MEAAVRDHVVHPMRHCDDLEQAVAVSYVMTANCVMVIVVLVFIPRVMTFTALPRIRAARSIQLGGPYDEKRA